MSFSAGVQPLSRCWRQGFLPVVDLGFAAVHRQRSRGRVGTPPWRRWGRSGGAVFHACTASGIGTREVR